MPLIFRTRSIEAKQELKHIYTLERTYFFEFSKYSNELEKDWFRSRKNWCRIGRWKVVFVVNNFVVVDI